jgi:hypothetical protein
MLCEDMRRMLLELDSLELLMNDAAKSPTERSEAVQKAQDLGGRIREHRESHDGCDINPRSSA